MSGLFYLGKGNAQVGASTLDRGNTTVPANCVFNSGEHNYANLLMPTAARSHIFKPYWYRHYPGTNSYVGISSQDTNLHYMGSASSDPMLGLGSMASQKQTEGCL